ncbi:MAG: MoxR family ATPase, partial [Phycisphaerales bacterium]|nr:MoxR family ATPase [Phycisphaerales bacterium]
FFVLATQNPIEMEGTYPLPEAQLDRFMFKLNVGYSALDELMTILDRTTGSATPTVQPRIDGPGILEAQQLVRSAIVAPHVQEYAARLCMSTHPEGRFALGITNQYIRVGASPRAAQALILGGKVKALCDGRYHVAYGDIAAIAKPVLRHRVVLNFEAEADRVTPDAIIENLLEGTPHAPVATA